MPIWEVRFTVDGIQLPEDKVIFNENFTFEKLPEKIDVVRVSVKVSGTTSDQVSSLAIRRLNNFLGIYSICQERNLSPKIVKLEGGSQLPDSQTDTNRRIRKWLPSFGGPVTIRVHPMIDTEELNETLRRSREIFNSVNLNSRGKLYLTIALDYFRHGNSAERNEDKLINYMIAMEALYLHERDELSYRLSHRVSSLLGETDEERDEVFGNMRKMYRKRSEVVHGEQTSISDEEISALRKHVRDSIGLFIGLSRRYSRQGIHEHLDESVTISETRARIQRESRELFSHE